MGRISNMPEEERFTRTLFGVIMIGSVFVGWGKWVIFVLGVLFLISAWLGYCATCEAYKKLIKKT